MALGPIYNQQKPSHPPVQTSPSPQGAPETTQGHHLDSSGIANAASALKLLVSSPARCVRPNLFIHTQTHVTVTGSDTPIPIWFVGDLGSSRSVIEQFIQKTFEKLRAATSSEAMDIILQGKKQGFKPLAKFVFVHKDQFSKFAAACENSEEIKDAAGLHFENHNASYVEYRPEEISHIAAGNASDISSYSLFHISIHEALHGLKLNNPASWKALETRYRQLKNLAFPRKADYERFVALEDKFVTRGKLNEREQTEFTRLSEQANQYFLDPHSATNVDEFFATYGEAYLSAAGSPNQNDLLEKSPLDYLLFEKFFEKKGVDPSVFGPKIKPDEAIAEAQKAANQLKYKTALAYLGVLGPHPLSREAYDLLIEVNFQLGYYDQALDVWLTALEKFPSYEPKWSFYNAFLARVNSDNAEAFLPRLEKISDFSYKKNPGSSAINKWFLANTYRKFGQIHEALLHYKQALPYLEGNLAFHMDFAKALSSEPNADPQEIAELLLRGVQKDLRKTPLDFDESYPQIAALLKDGESFYQLAEIYYARHFLGFARLAYHSAVLLGKDLKNNPHYLELFPEEKITPIKVSAPDSTAQAVTKMAAPKKKSLSFQLTPGIGLEYRDIEIAGAGQIDSTSQTIAGPRASFLLSGLLLSLDGSMSIRPPHSTGLEKPMPNMKITRQYFISDSLWEIRRILLELRYMLVLRV